MSFSWSQPLPRLDLEGDFLAVALDDDFKTLAGGQPVGEALQAVDAVDGAALELDEAVGEIEASNVRAKALYAAQRFEDAGSAALKIKTLQHDMAENQEQYQHAEEMYNPAAYGRSDGGTFVVTPRGQ